MGNGNIEGKNRGFSGYGNSQMAELGQVSPGSHFNGKPHGIILASHQEEFSVLIECQHRPQESGKCSGKWLVVQCVPGDFEGYGVFPPRTRRRLLHILGIGGRLKDGGDLPGIIGPVNRKLKQPDGVIIKMRKDQAGGDQPDFGNSPEVV